MLGRLRGQLTDPPREGRRSSRWLFGQPGRPSSLPSSGSPAAGAILAAFIPGLPWTPEAFQLWLVIFNVGAIAVAAAVSRRQASSASFLRTAAAAAILANAWYLVMVVLSIGRPQPPEADPEFRLVGFFAGAAMWLANAAFGAAALRDRAVARLAALALTVGSPLAFTGMDRLELVRGEIGWLFTPLALVGIALNGAAWIMIGIELLRRERPVPERPIPEMAL